MKIILLSTVLGLFLSTNLMGQDDYKYWVLEQRTPDWALTSLDKLDVPKKYKISDFVNPFYLEEDFNGDSYLDIALLIENKETTHKGIIIIHGHGNGYQIIGAGTKFGNGSDDYFWMDVWKVYRSSKSHELTFTENNDIDGSKEINVHNPSIEVIKTEASSGLIYWDGNKYKWAQTSD